MLMLCAVILMTSCSLEDDDQINVAYPLVPVQSVVVPDTMVIGTEYEVDITYTLPTNCHTFNGLIAEEQENLLYIGVQSVQDLDNAECSETMETGQTSFKFRPTPTITGDSYTFKFWQSEDEQGANYLTEEVVIISESGGDE